jgi:hypothetical protein
VISQDPAFKLQINDRHSPQFKEAFMSSKWSVLFPVAVGGILPVIFRGFGASATVVTGPPAAGMVFSFPSEKKPMDAPSGDQKGKVAPSVPASFLELRSFALWAQ